MTYTYVTMDVSPATYAEIREKLEDAGYQHALHEEAEWVRVNPDVDTFDRFLCIYCAKYTKLTTPIKLSAAVGVEIKCEHCDKCSSLLTNGTIPTKILKKCTVLDMHGIALKLQPEPEPTPHADAEARKQTRAGKPL